MSELAQLDMLMSPDVGFWKDDYYSSFEQDGPGGLRVEIAEDAGKYNWKVTYPDRREWKSLKSLRSQQEAKNDLWEELKRRRDALDYERMGPANIS